MSGGEAQRNRLLEASMAGNECIPTTLKRLEAAISARDTLNGLSYYASEIEFAEADKRSLEARDTVLNHLLDAHGITRAMARNLGDLL